MRKSFLICAYVICIMSVATTASASEIIANNDGCGRIVQGSSGQITGASLIYLNTEKDFAVLELKVWYQNALLTKLTMDGNFVPSEYRDGRVIEYLQSILQAVTVDNLNVKIDCLGGGMVKNIKKIEIVK